MRTIALVKHERRQWQDHCISPAPRAEHGHNVAVLDLDPQQSAAKWGDRRAAPVPVVLAAPPSRLGPELQRVADAGADMVLIDTPPRAGSDNAALAAARTADLVVLPCRPAILDLETVASTAARVRDVAQVPVVAVLNGCPSRGRTAEEAAAALVRLGVEVCPVRIGQRIAFARSLLDGRTAHELEPGGRAADETARTGELNEQQLCRCVGGRQQLDGEPAAGGGVPPGPQARRRLRGSGRSAPAPGDRRRGGHQHSGADRRKRSRCCFSRGNTACACERPGAGARCMLQMMRYRMRTFLRLWRWRRDWAWRRALILDTLRGRLELRGACRLIRLEKPPAPQRLDSQQRPRRGDFPA